MKQFLYFIPSGPPQPSLDEIEELGLGYAFDSKATARRVLGPGPNGRVGVIIGRSGDGQFGYFRDTQTWKPLWQGKKITKEQPARVWVGLNRDARPTPNDLARAEQLPGKRLRAEDGSEWLVPIAICHEETADDILTINMLPSMKTRDPESGGWVHGAPKERYRRLWEVVTDWATQDSAARKAAIEAGKDRYTKPECRHDAAFEALKANYRVSETELDLLNVIDEQFVDRALDIVIDSDGHAALVKKKARTILESGAGTDGPKPSEMDAAPTTDQRSPIGTH